MLLIQIVPRLPPAINGLGDYALNLARQLQCDFGVNTHFIVGDNSWAGETSIDGFVISRIDTRSDTALLSKLTKINNVGAILLHYVGYGYARRGCPLWLIDGLARWKEDAPKSSLLTMFHETHASGPPWTSAFWLSSTQKHLAARLAQISDNCLTSRSASAELIKKLSRGKHIEVQILPVFSSVGELKLTRPLTERSRKMMVFGTMGRRLQVYQRSREVLGQLCRQFGIGEIFDVGRPIDLNGFDIPDVRITVLGEASRETVSSLLANSVIGFLDYPEQLLGKSSIFAAYCAHRVLPVIATNGEAPGADGLEAGQHYWPSHFNVEDLTPARSQRIADNAANWYQAHSLPKQAEVFASYLMNRNTVFV